jgi:hypothetical protein
MFFYWTQEATEDFEKLKEAMCRTPVLATIDFKKTFIVKFYSIRGGISPILMKKKEAPLPLKATNLKGRTYSNPYVRKKCWTYSMELNNEQYPYLIRRHFKVKEDHDNVKYLE